MLLSHRVNTTAQLLRTPRDVGFEIDLRHDPASGRFYMAHDEQPGAKLGGDVEFFDIWLATLAQRGWDAPPLVALNVKEMGFEAEVLEACRLVGLPDSHVWIQDGEFPYVYAATKRGDRRVSVRYSEAEPLEMAERLIQLGQHFNWLWIDTNTQLPLDAASARRIQALQVNTCLVCPERWGRSQDIAIYADKLRRLRDETGFVLDAVMTNEKFIDAWREAAVTATEFRLVR